MSDDKVRFVWVLQDRNDGKWMPKHKGAAWTDDDLRRYEFHEREDAEQAAQAYGNAVVVDHRLDCFWSEYDMACDAVKQADSLAKFTSALGCDEAVDTVTEALLGYARRLRKGYDP